MAKADALNAPKLAETIELFLKRKGKPGRYWSELERTFEREIVPAFGSDRTVQSITKAEVRSLIEAKGEKHSGAARTLFAAIRPFFGWCVERDIISKSPADDLAPPPAPENRDRILIDGELKSFWSATDGWPLFGPFYRLLLLTAQRREEVAGMRWPEIDVVACTWTIPKERTKNGKAHLVHLSRQAIDCLPARGVSPLVFTTTGRSSISGYSYAKTQLDDRMPGVPAWRVHDLRRTAASGMAMPGFQPHIIERVLNHVSGAQGGLVGVYQRYEYLEERKQALCAWGRYVESVVSDRPKADNVIALHCAT